MKTEEDILKQKKLFDYYRQEYFNQLPRPNTDPDTVIEVLKMIKETKIVDNVLEWILNDDANNIFFITSYVSMSGKMFNGFKSGSTEQFDDDNNNM